MNFKAILETAVGVALGVVLAGIVSKMLDKNKENFDNE
jgi:hypothetical protein